MGAFADAGGTVVVSFLYTACMVNIVGAMSRYGIKRVIRREAFGRP
jgi:hypothetical protein